MELVMYSVYDKAVGAYMRPFFMQSDGQATRMFMDDANNADSPISAHPEDYSLFRCGRWYDEGGDLVPEEPVCIARAHELVEESRRIAPGSLKQLDSDGYPLNGGQRPQE